MFGKHVAIDGKRNHRKGTNRTVYIHLRRVFVSPMATLVKNLRVGRKVEWA